MSFTTYSDSQSSNASGVFKSLHTLKEDISSALNCLTEPLPDRFHHHLNDATAPNPGLEVAGAGLIRLPLSLHDAEAIASLTSGPSVDIGQYELDSSLVSFRNPRWGAYVATKLLQMVTQAFMLPDYATEQATLQLNKVIVWLTHQQDGTSPPASQVVPTPTTFGHALVTLPSQFEQGHATFTLGNNGGDTVDFSRDAEFDTSILAWHSGVNCAFEPLVSGCRLALEYTIEIGNLPSICHRLPSPFRILNLQETAHNVLLGWKNGEYQLPHPPMIIHPNTAHGPTFHSVLLPVAKQLGFTICKARVEIQREGEGEDSQEEYDQRRRRAGFCSSLDDWEEEGFTPPMRSSFSMKISVTMGECLGDEGGSALLHGLSLAIDKGCLAPSVFARKDEPDEAEYSAFADRMGPGHLEQHSYTDSLVILQEKDAIPLAVSYQPIEWSIAQLRSLDRRPPPTSQKLALVAAVSDKLISVDNQNREARNSSHGKTIDITGAAKDVMRCGIAWRDPGLWAKALPFSGLSPHDIARATTSVIGKLGISFASIEHGVEAALEYAPDPVQRLDIVNHLYDRLYESDGDVPRSWFKQHAHDQLEQYDRPQQGDIPVIIETAKRCGLRSLGNFLIPSLVHRGGDTFEFLVGLLQGISGVRDIVPERLEGQYLEVIRICYLAAAKQWRNGYQGPNTQPYEYRYHQLPNTLRPGATNIERVCLLVKAALSEKDLAPLLGPLLELVAPKDEGSLSGLQAAFRDVYIPLVPHLKEIMANSSLTVLASPFKAFFQSIVRTYMDRILGLEEPLASPETPPIMCGCSDCHVLCTFLNSAKPKFSLKIEAHRRAHLETQIAMSPRARDMVTTATIVGSTPYTLAITKTKAVAERATWDGRKVAAREFLEMIGDDGDLLAIMGKPMFERARREFSPPLE